MTPDVGQLVLVTLDDVRRVVAEEVARAITPVVTALRERPAPPSSDSDRLLSRREVATRLGIHPRSVRRLILENQFPAGVRVGAGGRAVRFRASDVEAFIDARGERP